MRPLLVLVMAVAVLGGMKWLMDSQAAQRPAPAGAPIELSEATYQLELSLTFEAGPDPFSLEDPKDAPSVFVQLAGRTLYRTQEVVPLDVPVVVDDVTGLAVGDNHFFVQANPRDPAPFFRALRLRVLREGNPVGSAVFWAEPGDAVQGTLLVHIEN